MKEASLFDNWLRKLSDDSAHPFVRDCEFLVQYFLELYNQMPTEYGWRVYTVESFREAMQKLKEIKKTADDMNQLYWHDMAGNIEAYGVMMVWRAGEIINHVIKSLNSKDILTPAILSRSLLEIAAFTLKNSNIILKTLENIDSSLSQKTTKDILVASKDLEELLLQMIWGTRLEEFSDHPRQKNVLTYIQWLSKNPNAKELWPI